jgi:integrase
LKWEDVDFQRGKILLSDHKVKTGRRDRWNDMHPLLIHALQWWKDERPYAVDNVFMQERANLYVRPGEPYRINSQLMPRLCKRAGVKPFGFHALRHKSAAVVYPVAGLFGSQTILGHNNANETDRYIKSVGLYESQEKILEALENSGIGRAVGSLLMEMETPYADRCQGDFCNPEFVTQ